MCGFCGAFMNNASFFLKTVALQTMSIHNNFIRFSFNVNIDKVSVFCLTTSKFPEEQNIPISLFFSSHCNFSDSIQTFFAFDCTITTITHSGYVFAVHWVISIIILFYFIQMIWKRSVTELSELRSCGRRWNYLWIADVYIFLSLNVSRLSESLWRVDWNEKRN